MVNPIRRREKKRPSPHRAKLVRAAGRSFVDGASQPTRRRDGGPATARKQAPQGIYGAVPAVRATLETCLGDPDRNWTLAAMAELLRQRHGWVISQQCVSKYRRRWLARKALPAVRAEPVTIQISLPAGTRLNVLRLRRP